MAIVQILPQKWWQVLRILIQIIVFQTEKEIELTVSSEQMALNWVPNMIHVKMANSTPSNIRNTSKSVVAGGANILHSENILMRILYINEQNYSSLLTVGVYC